MIVWAGVAGLVVGSLLNWAADYLPRFASRPVARRTPVLESALVRVALEIASHKGRARGPARRTAALVELVMGLALVSLWSLQGWTEKGLWLALACAFLVLVALIDLRYRLVLNVLILPAVPLVLWVRLATGGNPAAVVVGGAFGLAIFGAAYLVRPGGLGLGDVKLAGLIGLFLGFPTVLWALLVGVLAGGIAVVYLAGIRRWGLSRHIPYAPFLCLGAIIALFYNPIPVLFHWV